jgi:citrate lyase alpha subunit
VKGGVVVPNVPLPEGARVEVIVTDAARAVEPDLQEEFDAWDRASARALETVERLAEEADGADEKG